MSGGLRHYPSQNISLLVSMLKSLEEIENENNNKYKERRFVKKTSTARVKVKLMRLMRPWTCTFLQSCDISLKI